MFFSGTVGDGLVNFNSCMCLINVLFQCRIGIANISIIGEKEFFEVSHHLSSMNQYGIPIIYPDVPNAWNIYLHEWLKLW